MRYLRGDASQQERDAMAQRLAQDDALFLRLEELETEWIDQLARGELSAEAAGEARRYLRETGQEERVTIARAIAAAAEETVGTPEPEAQRLQWWRIRRFPVLAHKAWLAPAALAACLVVAVAGWQFVWNPARDTAPDSSVPGAARLPLARPEVTLMLPALITRGGEAAAGVGRAAPEDALRLRFEIPEGRDFPGYRVDLLESGDRVGRSFHAVKGNAGEIAFAEVRAGAGTLPAGTHELALYGLSQSGEETLLGYYSLTIAATPSPGSPQ